MRRSFWEGVSAKSFGVFAAFFFYDVLELAGAVGATDVGNLRVFAEDDGVVAGGVGIEAVFVGDAAEDFEASAAFGVEVDIAFFDLVAEDPHVRAIADRS